MIDTLEKEYAEFNNTEYAVAVSSGTGALHLAMAAIGIGEGDEVIVPEYTMIASAWAVTYTGATPVFVDCGDDLLIDVDKIEAAITPRTKAIMPVHVYGRVCNMEKIIQLALKYGLRVIEDCAEAHGAEYDNLLEQKVGSFDIGCFSLYRSKIISAEEGGLITLNSYREYKKMQDMKALCFGDKFDYTHKQIGFNYRIAPTQAQLALNSLHNYEQNIEKRQQIAGWYDKYLPKKMRMPQRDVVWVYDTKHKNKDIIIEKLKEKGVGARYGFKPMSSQSMYLDENYKKLKAHTEGKDIFYLPVDPLMTETLIKLICTIVKENV